MLVLVHLQKKLF